MAGIPVNKGEIDLATGAACRQVFRALDDVEKIKAWLDTVSASDLETVYGYTATEAAQIKSAFADLAKLATVFTGGDTVTSAYDFRVFSKLLIGVGLY